METWKTNGMYYVNNFPSDYLIEAVDGGNVFCAGEIDPGLALSTKDSVDEVHVAEIDRKTALFGEWKKSAIQNMGPAKYISILWNLSRKSPMLLPRSRESRQEELFSILEKYLEKKDLGDILEGEDRESFQMKIDEIYDYSREELPKDLSVELKDPEDISESFEGQLPYAFVDNGPISNLDYIVDNYQEVRENIDKVDIVERGALESLDNFPDEYFDYINLNNVLDYHDWKEEGYVREVFELVNEKLKNGGKVILASKYYEMEGSNSNLHCYEDGDGLLRLSEDGSESWDCYTNEKMYLDTVLEELGFQTVNLNLRCSGEEFVTPSILKLGKSISPLEDCDMAVEAYQKVSKNVGKSA